MIDSISKYKKIFLFLFILLIIISLGQYLKYFVIQFYLRASFPYEADFTEGEELVSSVKIYKLENPYPKLDSYPYIAAIYGPSYYIASAFLMPIFGQILLTGRLVTFISVLSISFLIFLIVKLKDRDTIASIAVSLLFFSSPLVHEWGSRFRGDYFAIFLSFLGLYLFIKYEDSKTRNWSIVPFILASFYKITYILGPASCLFYLFLSNKGKKRITVSSAYLGVFLFFYALIFITLNIITKEQYFINTILLQMKNPVAMSFEIKAFILRWGAYFKEDYPILILGILFGLYGLCRFRLQKFNILVLYFFLSLISSLHVGFRDSSSNHLLEIHASSLIVLGLFFSHIRRNKTNILAYKLLSNSIFIMLLVLICLTRPIKISSYSYYKPNPEWEVAHRQINELIKATPDPVIIDSQMSYLVLNNKKVLYEPFVMSLMHTAGLCDISKSEIIKDIRRKKFNLFVYRQRFINPQLLMEFWENYLLAERIGPNGDYYEFYKPMQESMCGETKKILKDQYSLGFWQKYPFQKPLEKWIEKDIALLAFSSIDMQECDKLITSIMQVPDIIGIYKPLSDKPNFVAAFHIEEKKELKKMLKTIEQGRRFYPLFANDSLICTKEYSDKGEEIISFQLFFSSEGYKKSYCALGEKCVFQVLEESGTQRSETEPNIYTREKEAHIIYKINSKLSIHRVILETFPRIYLGSGGIHRIVCSYSMDGSNFTNIYEMKGENKDVWWPIGVKRIDDIIINNPVVYIKFTLLGCGSGTQIWSSFVYPMKFKLIFDKFI